MALDISREIAHTRNTPGGNWLACALQKIQDELNQSAAKAAKSSPSGVAFPTASPKVASSSSTPVAGSTVVEQSSIHVNNALVASPNLNDSLPAAPAVQQDIKWQTATSNVSAYDPVMQGDSGSGGLAGNVPAPAAGDAAAGKFLKADGTWEEPVSGVTSLDSITGAVSLVAGSNVTITDNSPSAGQITIASTGGGGGGTLGTTNGGWSYADVPPASPTGYDDEFNGTSLDPKWTIHNAGTATFSVADGDLTIYAPPNNGDSVRYITQPAPTPPWTFVLKVHGANAFPENYSVFALALSDSSGKLVMFGPNFNTVAAGGGYALVLNYWNSATSFNSSPAGQPVPFASSRYVKVADDGTNLSFSYSASGVSYIPFMTVSATAFLSAGPTLIGIGVDSNNASHPAAGDFDFIRRTQ